MDPDVSLRVDQIADLAYYIANPKCLNLSEPGSGKTPSVVVMQWVMWNTLEIGTAWIMPKSLLFKNKREILRFTNFEDADVAILEGTPSQIRKTLQGPAKIFLMSFRRWTISWRHLPKFVKACHVDEFHKGFKSPDSQACQALFAAFRYDRFTYFLPMTGTLISGRLDSAYAAIHVVESGYYPSYTSFKNYHALYDFSDKIIGWKNHAKLAEIFRRHGIRRLFKDIHGEQEIVLQTEVVEMNSKQRDMYDEFHEKAVLELEKFFLDGTQPGVAFIRARQLMEHPNHFPDLTGETHYIDIMPGETPAKEDALEIHLEDHKVLKKPLIIFSAMRPQQTRVELLLKKWGLRYGVLNGSTKDRDSIDLAVANGDLDVVLATPAVADVGYNWQFWGGVEIDHIIFMTSDYLDTTILQAIQRAIRQNRTHPLRVTFMEYADSLDQLILNIAYKKSVDANKVDPTRPILQLSRYEKDYSV